MRQEHILEQAEEVISTIGAEGEQVKPTTPSIDQKNAMLDFDDEDLEETLAHISDEQEKEHEKMWRLHFRGKVPASWRIWHGITKDLRENKGHSLPNDLIDAAVTHPSWHVVTAVCQNHQLSPEQLAIAITQLGGLRAEEAISSQRALGVSDMDINEARKIVEKHRAGLFMKKLQTQN